MSPTRSGLVNEQGRRDDGTGPADVAELLLDNHEDAVLRALARVLARRGERRDADDRAAGRRR